MLVLPVVVLVVEGIGLTVVDALLDAEDDEELELFDKLDVSEFFLDPLFELLELLWLVFVEIFWLVFVDVETFWLVFVDVEIFRFVLVVLVDVFDEAFEVVLFVLVVDVVVVFVAVDGVVFVVVEF
jgi:hypothetical protein